MQETTINTLLDAFVSVTPPFSGSIAKWANENIKLPQNYAQPGRVDLSTSPWLLPPLDDVLNPKVKMVVKIMAIRLGKSMTDELAIPFLISQSPGPMLRVHQDDDMADNITETKLLPILQSTECISPLLPKNKGGKVKKGLIKFPHMFLRISGDKETIANSIGIRYLFMDEPHLYEVGFIEKFIGRTVDFAGRRKIVLSSTPNSVGSELEKYYNSGIIWEWQWQCPNCKKHQPYYWSKQRNDGTYAGFTWDTILTEDKEHTDIHKSAKTTWLECFHCKHQIHDNITNRKLLNDNGKYICIKSDGDPEIHCYTCPLFVNINLSFESFAIQYLTAKRTKRRLGLDEDLITFVNQVLSKFYKADPESDHSKIARGDYIPNPSDYDKDWVNIMTVDYQRIGKSKIYVIRAWNKNGNESRRLAHGICARWDEIEEIRKRWNVRIPCVGIDSGDETQEVYQECIKHNEDAYDPVLKKKIFLSWMPMKGDQKLSWPHGDGNNKIMKYYSPISKQAVTWTPDSKFYGRTAKLIIWSNYSIKTILMNLRDDKAPGIKWLVDSKDQEYENQLYSENLLSVLDKKTGLTTSRWVKINDNNHYLDCEAMNLTLAIRLNLFSATNVDESELKAVIDKNEKK